MKNQLIKPKSRKNKDVCLFLYVHSMINEVDFWNNKLYPKNEITKQDIFDEIDRIFKLKGIEI